MGNSFSYTQPLPSKSKATSFFEIVPKDIRSSIINYLDYDNVHKLMKVEDEGMVRMSTLRLYSERKVFLSVKEFLQWPELRESSIIVEINNIEEFNQISEMKKIIPRMFIKYHQFGRWDATKFMIFLSLFEKRYGPCITEQIKNAEKYRAFSQTNPPPFISFYRREDSHLSMNWRSVEFFYGFDVCMQLLPNAIFTYR
jgi:hypothetical protein